MKKIISLFLILTLITGIGAFVPAVSAAASGTCGPNLTWTLDNNGKLTVSGTGGMDEWLNNTSVPWYSYHDQIKTIVIGEGVTNIGFGAIFAFSELTSIKIPTTVSSIDKMSFAHSCRKLQTVTVTSGNPYYVSTNGILYNKDKTILVKYPAAKTATSFTVPSTVTTISNGAFDYAAALKSVTLPSGLKDIDSSAFQLCTGLSSITLPEGLEGVGNYAFDGTALTTIDFPASVRYINSYVCRNCNSLTTATIRNPECRAWGWGATTFPESTVLWGYAGSTLNDYATRYNRTFRAFVEGVSLPAAAAVNKDATITLTATVTPDAAYNKGVTWSSSNTAVAAVNQSGKVTGVAPGTAVITAKSNEDNSIKATCTVTVQLAQYTVSYNANGGENAPANQTKVYEQDLTLSSDIPTREGYKFNGWNTKADGSGTAYAPGDVYTANAGLSLFAQWKEKKQTRIFGNSRYDTADEISDEGWPDGADTVVLANGTNFADALAGGPLAYKLDAPILLTAGKAQLEETVAAQIEKLGATNIVILGGSAAISNEIEAALTQKYTVERVYGTTRYDTALEISKLVNPDPTTVFVVTGTGYADALSVSPYAAMKGYPIVYSNPNSGLTSETVEYLASAQKIYIIGGEMAVGQNTVDQLEGKDAERIFGTSRYLTSFEIASKFADEFGDSVMFATGTNFPDALAGGVLGAKLRSPLLLVHPSGAIDEIKNFVLTKDPANIYILGGTGAVPDSVIEGIFE